MAYTIRYQPQAKTDVKEIKNYLSRFYPSTPNKFVATLRVQIQSLRENPYMYATYPGYPAYRRVIVSNYLVFYKVDEENKRVEIHRVLHGSWDIPSYLI
jgi:addiction module RelE/StbE family toxin